VIRAHQPGSEPIDIPETIPNPVVVPKPTPTPTEPAPKEPVRIPERVPGTARVACSAGRSGFPAPLRRRRTASVPFPKP
jgi:hypothetical protein